MNDRDKKLLAEIEDVIKKIRANYLSANTEIEALSKKTMKDLGVLEEEILSFKKSMIEEIEAKAVSKSREIISSQN